MWIGLLFGIMCLATQYEQFSSNGPDQFANIQSASDSNRLSHIYREKTVQCLILGKYITAVPYTIETLLLYYQTEFLRSEDT